MARLRLPRTVFRNALINTEEPSYASTRVNPELQAVELDGLSSDEPRTLFTCTQALMRLWTWRSRAQEKKGQQSRLAIEANISKLTDNINSHEARQIEFEQTLKQCVVEKNRSRARRILLQKKRNTNMVNSLYAYRDNLEGVLMSLDESNEQQELVASFKSANKVLRYHTVKDQDGVEAFDNLADDLHDARQDVEELQNAVTSRVTVDDAGLEEELGELFDVPPAPPSEAPPIPAFPRVPTTPVQIPITQRVPLRL